VWTTEFGRTPYNTSADAKGREHHHQVFSSLLAGGGVKGGLAYGKSDEHGIAVAEDRVHVHDLHATILHLLGLDHDGLTYRHAGRDYRLTDVAGLVVRKDRTLRTRTYFALFDGYAVRLMAPTSPARLVVA